MSTLPNPTPSRPTFWRWFRRQSTLTQLLGWLLFYWLIIPVLILQSRLHNLLKFTLVVPPLLFACMVGIAITTSSDVSGTSDIRPTDAAPAQPTALPAGAVADAASADAAPTAEPMPTGSFVSLGPGLAAVLEPMTALGYRFEQVDLQPDGSLLYPIYRASDQDATVQIIGTDDAVVRASVQFQWPASPTQERNALITARQLFAVSVPDWADSAAWVESQVAQAKTTDPRYTAEYALDEQRFAGISTIGTTEGILITLSIEGYDATAEAPYQLPTAQAAEPTAAAVEAAPVAPAPIVREGDWNWQELSAAEFGDAWPLTVAGGRLGCMGGNGFGDIVFVVDGQRYAVNGMAAGRKDSSGRLLYRDIESIWRDDPTFAGLKVNIGPILDRGQILCQ